MRTEKNDMVVAIEDDVAEKTVVQYFELDDAGYCVNLNGDIGITEL
jgi:hypothetical protein